MPVVGVRGRVVVVEAAAQQVLEGVGAALGVAARVPRCAGGLGDGGQGGLEAVGEDGVGHRVQVGEVAEAVQAHQPPTLGADVVVFAVGTDPAR
jgi:hypothetical protein